MLIGKIRVTCILPRAGRRAVAGPCNGSVSTFTNMFLRVSVVPQGGQHGPCSNACGRGSREFCGNARSPIVEFPRPGTGRGDASRDARRPHPTVAGARLQVVTLLLETAAGGFEFLFVP